MVTKYEAPTHPTSTAPMSKLFLFVAGGTAPAAEVGAAVGAAAAAGGGGGGGGGVVELEIFGSPTMPVFFAEVTLLAAWPCRWCQVVEFISERACGRCWRYCYSRSMFCTNPPHMAGHHSGGSGLCCSKKWHKRPFEGHVFPYC